jgi:hypothetical protein
MGKTKVKKYRKRALVVEAVQWTGKNAHVVFDFMGLTNQIIGPKGEIYIKTLEGEMVAKEGDYIIKGIKGEFYPIKKDIFIDTYEEETK